VLETRVLSLSILTDNAEVNVLMPCLVTGNILDQNDRSEDIEFLTESNVE
jgi:hypothetical protein